MPTLPVPFPLIPAGGDLPVKSTDDCRDALPDNVRRPRPEDAPVREAILAGETAMFLAYQERAAYAAAQSDPTRAVGIYLQAHAEDRGVDVKDDEPDEQLRTRVFQRDLISPTAILAAADAILAPYTSKRARYLESGLDRLFIGDGTATFHSFIAYVDPEYPDRLYDERRGNPGGPWVFGDHNGRFFVLRVPEIASVTSVGIRSHIFAGGAPPTEERAWIHDGTDEGGSESSGLVASFTSHSLSEPLAVYQAIADAVGRLVGNGVRWQLYVDPNL